MIIDAHTHLGYDCVFDLKNTKNDILNNFEKYGIDGAIVQPFIERPYLEETQRIHNEIHDLCAAYPGRFWGMASINPHFRAEDYENEAERCIKELGFVGIKMTPAGHAVNPTSKDGMHVFEVARTLNIPVMVHTGIGIPFADPAGIYPAAKTFPDVQIVIAHAGANFYTQQALYLAQNFDNIYIEPSGAGIEATASLLHALGPERIMYSSDVTINIPMELTKYRTLLSNSKDLEQVFSKTVKQVFRLH